MSIDPDLLDDDLSSAMGTETLVGHNLVPDGLPTSSGPEQQIHYIRGARYLVVDQTANRRHSSKPFSLAQALSSSPMTFFLAMAVVRRRKRRWKGRVLKERTITISKTSAAGRLKYDIHLPGSGKDREF